MINYGEEKMKLLKISIVVLFFLINGAFSQDRPDIVKTRMIISVNKFQSGNSFELAIALEIEEPYHINSSQPTESYLIPTLVEFNPQEGVTFGKIYYPSPQLKKFSFSEKPLAVFEGTVYVFTNVSLNPEFNKNEVLLEGTVSFQACDDQACLAPQQLDFKQIIPVVPPSEAIQKINLDIFLQKEQKFPTSDVEESSSFSNSLEQKGLILTFILVFLGGLALNLTPCVYPLIPITISYFGGQAKGKSGSLFSHAFLYLVGMALTYSILGLIAAFTGALFGAALQNPFVLLGIALVLVTLALSMFDLYELRVPLFLTNFAGGSRQGYLGSLFMGLTVGIVAAPCIGPFVLALLTYVGEKGDLLLGFSMFFILALGLGVPFMFLAIFSGKINQLPRSGAWMVWVRAIFGFVLIAMAVYFLSPIFPDSLYYYFTLATIFLIGGIYMAWIEPTQTSGKIFPIIRNLVGIIFFIIFLILATTGVQSYIDEKLEYAEISVSGNVVDDKISWMFYSDDIQEIAYSQKKPIMLDFYADWCIPCKELDKFTFSDRDVIELSKRFLMVKVDLTQTNDPNSISLREKYQIKGVPTLIFLSPRNEEIPGTRVVGFLEKDEFLPIMHLAINQS
jgi:thiol:disulfide interchange protein DsbD